jgi:hypothetical protein
VEKRNGGKVLVVRTIPVSVGVVHEIYLQAHAKLSTATRGKEKVKK